MKKSVNTFTTIPKANRGQFQPPFTRTELQALLDNAVNGVIFVPSKVNKFRYMVKGVEGLQELVDVLTYIIQEDFKSGRFTNAAKNGYFCYTSSPENYAKVRKKLYGL